MSLRRSNRTIGSRVSTCHQVNSSSGAYVHDQSLTTHWRSKRCPRHTIATAKEADKTYALCALAYEAARSRLMNLTKRCH